MTQDQPPPKPKLTTPASIGKALRMPAAQAQKLLTRRQWREGDVAALQAAAARLGLMSDT